MILLLIFMCHTASAGTVDDYAAKRRQILEQAPENRKETLQNPPFNTGTTLGKYFYLSSFLYIENDPEFYRLTDSEIETLRTDYPQYYYEREVLMIWLSDLPFEEQFRKYRAIQTIARENNWSRIEGWTTSLLVYSLMTAELYFNAILEINNYIPLASGNFTSGMAYDYSLSDIFHNMSSALFSLGDYEGSLKFCRKYKAQAPEAPDVQLDGLSCEILALINLEKFDEAWAILKKMNRLVDENGSVKMRVQLLIYSAVYFREQERPDLTYIHAKDALDLYLKSERSSLSVEYSIYQLLTASQLELNNIENAEFYFQKMQEIPENYQTRGTHKEANDLYAKAKILSLKNKHETANKHYEKAFKLLFFRENANFKFNQLKSIDSSINARDAILTKQQLTREKLHFKIASTFAIISTLIAIVIGLVLWWHLRTRRNLQRYSRLDNLTRVFNRWYAIDLIKKHLGKLHSKDQSICVAIIDLDDFKQINQLFGHETGDAVLSHFARLCKYQFRDEDVFGRLGGEEFILMLNRATQADAIAKMTELREILCRQDLAKLGIESALTFSSGIVEVTQKADITEVLSQCDKLLYSAKQNGKDQNSCALFKFSEKIV